MTYAHWTERRHGRFHASPTNHAIGARMDHGRGKGTIVRISSFFCLSLSLSLETLIGPNSKDQMLFRLLIKGNRSGQGKNIVVYNFVTHETQRSRFLSFVYRHSIDFVDARRLFITSPTFFYNLLIRNTSRRWSTLAHCKRYYTRLSILVEEKKEEKKT